MADDRNRMTLADQAFVNAMMVITAPTFGDMANRELALDRVRELLPKINRTHPHLTALSEAAGLVLNAAGMTPGRAKTEAMSSAILRVRWAVADFAMWRLGLALEAMRGAQGNEQQDGRAA